MHKSLHLLLYYQYMGILHNKQGKSGVRTEGLGNEELDPQHYALCTLKCMYVLYCLLL